MLSSNSLNGNLAPWAGYSGIQAGFISLGKTGLCNPPLAMLVSVWVSEK